MQQATRVWVVGAGGQLGRALLAAAPSFATVVGTTRAQVDAADPDAVAREFERQRPQLIVNAAAYTAVDRAESDVAGATRGNVDAPRNLARVASQGGARLLHVSTDYVFNGAASVPYAVDAPAAPLGVYGSTKRAGELAVLESLPQDAVVLRTAWVYSAAGPGFLQTVLRLMKTNGTVRVVADQIGTPTSAVSLAEALWAFAARPQLHGVYHWTDAGAASWYDFAVAIAEEACARGMLPPGIAVHPIATRDYPTPARRPAYSLLDCRTTAVALELQPRHWRERLRTILETMRDA